MKKVVLILCLLHRIAMAQDCGSDYIDSAAFYCQPWIGNNQLLIDFNDSIQNVLQSEPQIESTENLTGGFDNQVFFNIPMKIWVYYSAAEPIPTKAQIQDGVRLLNNQFSGDQNITGQAGEHTQIKFYALHSISYILNEQMAINAAEGTYGPILENNYQPGAINIHIVIENSINFARFPWDFNDSPNPQYTYKRKPYVCLVTIGSLVSSTFAHEVGHALGLPHTHAFRSEGRNAFNRDAGICKQEAVDNSRNRNFFLCGNIKRICEENGDGLCDTEADPGLYPTAVNVSLSGQYIGGGQDNWNDPWNPNTFNIMSYSHSELREYFSPMQRAVMGKYIWYTHVQLPSNYPYLNFANFPVDVSEPDNQISTSNPIITFGESQWHNFHFEAIGRRPNATLVNNDVDFVRFEVPQPGKVINIYTSAVPHRPQANTEIYLIDQDGSTILASNDNISATNLFSEIKEIELAPGTYWIRIENKGFTYGEYAVTLEECGSSCCANAFIANETVINSATGPFNIGKLGTTQEFFGNSLNVNNSLFGVQLNMPTGFGSLNYPLNQATFELTFCNQAELTFESGTLEIGDPTNGRTAEVRFTEGTKLDLDGSSQIIVKNGSKLIIEAGAELNLAAGAQILLAGSDAVLEIEGTLQLGNNQNLSIGTLSGQTPGYIRFLPGAQVLAGSGAQIALGVPNNFRKVLELAPNAHISLPANLVQFAINHGEVQMAPGSRLIVPTKAVFVNARFERLGSTGLHHGVLLSGNHAHQITASRFNNAITGLEVNLMGNLHQPQLMVNQYNHNQIGLLVHGGGVLVGSGSFTSNTNWAMQLSALSAAAQVNNVTFTNNANGIKVSSANSHPISINGCSINQSAVQTGSVGVEVLQGNVTCRRNSISNYHVGIQGMGQNASIRLACNSISNCSDALITYNYSLFDLSNQARNSISSSTFSAMYTDLGTIQLQNGYNDFSSSNAFQIFGNMAPNCYALTTVNTKTGPVTFYDLPAENNKFESGFYYPNTAANYFPSGLEVDFHSCDAFGLMWVDQGNAYPMFRKANNPNITFVSCSQANPPWWQDVFNAVNLDSDPSQWIVTSPLYPGIELKQAIRTALNDITVDLDQPQHDSLALARFKQILTANYANMDEAGRELLATANAAMNYALTNAYALGILPVEYGVNPEPLDDAVYTLLASLDDLIANNDDPMMKSKYALDKVLLYRLAGHYETALNVLQNSEANQHTNYSYWDCTLQLEWSFFQGNISADQFALDAESCMSYFQARRQRRQPPVLPVYQNQSTTTLLVSPNPTSSSSVFSFAACENAASFRILDTQGKVVYRSELAAGATEHVVHATDLPAGIYFAELHQPNQKALRAKWVVRK